jgi:septin 7
VTFLFLTFEGESGLGKSTLINTLFNTGLYQPKEPLPPSAERPKTVAIESISAGTSLHQVTRPNAWSLNYTIDIEENGVRLLLTVVDTPGFGDFVNNDERFALLSLYFLSSSDTPLSWRPIVEDIESRFDQYLEYENKVNRQKVIDNRVHACLYFIQPTGHS